jgi:hypothetical protein
VGGVSHDGCGGGEVCMRGTYSFGGKSKREDKGNVLPGFSKNTGPGRGVPLFLCVSLREKNWRKRTERTGEELGKVRLLHNERSAGGGVYLLSGWKKEKKQSMINIGHSGVSGQCQGSFSFRTYAHMMNHG